MAIQTVSQIKSWFRRRMYPTQEQFSDLFDSYYHKLESIAMSKVDGLMAALNLKADKATDIVVDASTLESYDPTKLEGYLAGNVFVSYQNAFSTDPDLDFKELFIYQCVADAAMGESPETHPAKWERIGKTMTYTSSSTCNGWVGIMTHLYALTGMRDGDTVAVLQFNAVYKYSTATGTWNYFCELKPVVVQTTGNSTTAVMSQKAVTDAIAAASGGGSGLASTWEPNIAAIRALTSHNTGNDVGDYATLNIYEYDASLSNADDGDTYLKPNDVTGAGRWFKKKQLSLKSETDLCKTEGYKFKALAPDYAIVSKPFNFKVSAKIDIGGVATIKTSADVAYVINATVNAYDELKVYGDTIGMKTYLTVEKV